jgi:hypothetical protein
MSIKIVISDRVKFQVKGTVKNAEGVDEQFGFSLVAKRLDAEQIQNKLKSQEDQPLADFFIDVVEDWSGVRAADDKPLAYNADNLRALFRIPGLAALTFRTYLLEVGAKEKN